MQCFFHVDDCIRAQLSLHTQLLSPHTLSLSFSLIENLSKRLLVLTIVIKESKIRIRLTMLVAK